MRLSLLPLNNVSDFCILLGMRELTATKALLIGIMSCEIAFESDLGFPSLPREISGDDRSADNAAEDVWAGITAV